MARSRLPIRRKRSRRQTARPGALLLGALLLVVLVAAACWFGWLYREIDKVGRTDDAHPSDAIAVFGAAQYVGHPSPVFHARLDHALALYQENVAPLIIVLGGNADEHSTRSEGAVGRDYLLARGVPFDHILAETESVDTEQQVQDLANIARLRNLRSVVVVSDPSHLFRIAELCRQQDLVVHTSPRATFGTISPWSRRERVLHEMLSYTALRLHLQASFLHRWFLGREQL